MRNVFFGALFCIFFFDSSIYDFKIRALEERANINFADYRGKKLLIVNTACKSPYTFQLEELQKLYRAYKNKLVVIGMPAGDDFGDQEFKTNQQIRSFCTDTYGITFPMTEKVSTKGSYQHPLFAYLISEARKLTYDDDPVITWNFTKFLIDENGKLVKVFPPETTPLSVDVTSYLNNSNVVFK